MGAHGSTDHASKDEIEAAQHFDKLNGTQSFTTLPELLSAPCMKYATGIGKEAKISKPWQQSPRPYMSARAQLGTRKQESGQQRAARYGSMAAPVGEQRDKGSGKYKVGDLIELWSTSQNSWRRGSIEKVKGDLLHIVYCGNEGEPMLKIMPKDHHEVRLLQGNDCLKSHPNPEPIQPPIPSPAPPPAPAKLPATTPSPMVPQDLTTTQGAARGRDQTPFGVHRIIDATTSAPQSMPPFHSVQIPPGRAIGTPNLSQSQSQAYLPFQQLGGSLAAPPGNLLAGALQPLAPQSLQTTTTALAPVSLPSTCATAAVSVAAPCIASGEPTQTQARKKYVPLDVPNAVPLAPGIERLEPEVVRQLLQNNACVLVDVRGEDRAVGLIPGAIHIQAIDSIPFYEKIPGMLQRFKSQSLVVFTCQYSAHRAPQCANWYREQADSRQRVAVLSGGFRAWEGNGFPVESGGGDSNVADAYALQQGAQFAKMRHATPPKCAAALYAQLRG